MSVFDLSGPYFDPEDPLSVILVVLAVLIIFGTFVLQIGGNMPTPVH